MPGTEPWDDPDLEKAGLVDRLRAAASDFIATVTAPPADEEEPIPVARFLAADYETGGLDPRICPPLSMAVVSADTEYNELDGFSLRIRPPLNTVLAVPILRDQRDDPTLFNPKIDYYRNLYTGEMYDSHPENFYVVQAAAARINRFVQIEDDTWVISSVADWLENGVFVETAEHMLRQWLRQQFPSGHPIATAHNAVFDRGYCKQWMPGLYADLHPQWICTMLWYAKVLGKRKGTKLSDFCAAVGRPQLNAHEALSDTRDVLAALAWLSTNHPQHMSTVTS